MRLGFLANSLMAASVALLAPAVDRADAAIRFHPGDRQQDAFENGYKRGVKEGLKQGRRDDDGHRRFDYHRNRDYRNSVSDCHSRHGSRKAFAEGFRQGFEEGYRRGYDDGRHWRGSRQDRYRDRDGRDNGDDDWNNR